MGLDVNIGRFDVRMASGALYDTQCKQDVQLQHHVSMIFISVGLRCVSKVGIGIHLPATERQIHDQRETNNVTAVQLMKRFLV